MKSYARVSLLLVLILGMETAYSNPRDSDDDLGYVVFRDHCIACHLQSGHGIQAMGAPSIAGLPRWYVTDQLRKFRRNERGFSDEDAQGILMQTNAYALDERSIAFVGRYIESLERNQSRTTRNRSSGSDESLAYADACASCHGESCEGDRSQRAPPLINQQDWYLLRQLEKFSSGQRYHFDGYDPEKLSKEDLDGVISWIAQLP